MKEKGLLTWIEVINWSFVIETNLKQMILNLKGCIDEFFDITRDKNLTNYI